MNLPLLAGEIELESGETSTGTIVLTNYRLLLCLNDDQINSIPIGLIDEVVKNYQALNIHTKQCRLISCSFETAPDCAHWFKKISDALTELKSFHGVFGYKYYRALNNEWGLPQDEPNGQKHLMDRYLISLEGSAIVVRDRDSDSNNGSEKGNQEQDQQFYQAVGDDPQDAQDDQQQRDVIVDAIDEAGEDGDQSSNQPLSPTIPPPPSPPLEQQQPEEKEEQEQGHDQINEEGLDTVETTSVEKFTWICGLSKLPALKPQLNYTSNAVELEKSLTYFEYRRLRFDDDKGYASPNHVNNQDAFVKVAETGVERSMKPRWRISTANYDFNLCPSYPRFLIVPAEFSDEELKSVANFRYQSRLPTITWRYFKNGCVLARSSQPYVGWWGSRCDSDEKLLHLIVTSSVAINRVKPKQENNPDRGDQESVNQEAGQKSVGNIENYQNEQDCVQKTMLVVDCRSYTVAMVNRAKGGGCECSEYYNYCEIQFMGLANIHSIRKSFNSLRYLHEYDMYSDYYSLYSYLYSWQSLLNSSRWLQYISSLLKSANTIVQALEDDRSILIHCSDGWDRTPQLVSLVQLMADPYYRTYDGFRVLIEKEWIEYGHKFADRHGVIPEYDDSYERCPIFQQWLDCVYQIVLQHKDAFEFNTFFLETLLYHSYTCLFGTFLGNSNNHRTSRSIYLQITSLWPFLLHHKNRFINPNYVPKDGNDNIVTPSSEVKDLHLWTEVCYPKSEDTIKLSEIRAHLNRIS